MRKAKSDARLSMRAPVSRLTVHGDPTTLARLREVEGDLKAAGVIAVVEYVPAASFSVDIELDRDGGS